MVALLVLLLLSQTAFAVLLNEQTGEFTSALAARDGGRFWRAIWLALGLLIGAVPTYACFYCWVRDTLGIRWRRWLTHRFLQRYFDDHHYYALNAQASLDNPDQRIAEGHQHLHAALAVLPDDPDRLGDAAGRLQQRALWGISRTWSISSPSTLRRHLHHAARLRQTSDRAQLPPAQARADLRFGLVRVREGRGDRALPRRATGAAAGQGTASPASTRTTGAWSRPVLPQPVPITATRC